VFPGEAVDASPCTFGELNATPCFAHPLGEQAQIVKYLAHPLPANFYGLAALLHDGVSYGSRLFDDHRLLFRIVAKKEGSFDRDGIQVQGLL
jgi:hypothetical protein